MGKEHPNIAITLLNLARSVQKQGALQSAEPLYLEALADKRTRLLDVAGNQVTLLDALGRLGGERGVEPLPSGVFAATLGYTRFGETGELTLAQVAGVLFWGLFPAVTGMLTMRLLAEERGTRLSEARTAREALLAALQEKYAARRGGRLCGEFLGDLDARIKKELAGKE